MKIRDADGSAGLVVCVKEIVLLLMSELLRRRSCMRGPPLQRQAEDDRALRAPHATNVARMQDPAKGLETLIFSTAGFVICLGVSTVEDPSLNGHKTP
jgi:hypothetical protein